MNKKVKIALFCSIIATIFFLPICLLIWIEMPLNTTQDLEPFEWFGVRVFSIVCFIPIFLAQSALGGCLTYLFFHKKKCPALFWISCSGVAVVLILLILYFVIVYAFCRNNGWLYGIDLWRCLPFILDIVLSIIKY